MNLMNVLTCKWDDALLEACGGPELRAKIGPEPVLGGTVLGPISQWWVERWGFNPGLYFMLHSSVMFLSAHLFFCYLECIIAPFTGDNSATVVALSSPGDALLSLGTSTTLLLSIPPADTPPARFTTSHLLSHPTTLDAQIAMLCYKNGALAREQIRDRCAGSDWARYNELVEQSPPGNSGLMGFYFPLPEIIPPGVQGEFIFQCKDNEKPELLHGLQPDAAQHARAILESQFLSIKSRIAAILPAHSPPLQRLIVTGGSSANQTIRQLAADVFGMRVYVAESKEAAGTGGAVLAKFAWWKAQVGGVSGSFEEMTVETGEVERMRLVATPKGGVTKVYEGLVDNYRWCEERVVQLC